MNSSNASSRCRFSLERVASIIRLKAFRAVRFHIRPLLLALLCIAWNHAGAIRILVSGSASYNNGDPTSSQITNWDTGWGAGNITGWNYVGTVNGASGVYLGNNWVITAGHVGVGTFILDGTDYNMVAGSARSISNPGGGTADLNLFQVTQAPDLPPIQLAISDPVAYSTQVAMIGYGGGQGETWGLNTITAVNGTVGLQGYTSTDFETGYGNFELVGGTDFSNFAEFVSDDSGGGDFSYNNSTGEWNLTGINEEVNGQSDSFMVQVDAYSPQIDQITGVPEPDSSTLAVIALAFTMAVARRRRPRAGGNWRGFW